MGLLTKDQSWIIDEDIDTFSTEDKLEALRILDMQFQLDMYKTRRKEILNSMEKGRGKKKGKKIMSEVLFDNKNKTSRRDT